MRLTDIYRDHAEIMDDEVRQTLKYDDDVFDFDGLTYIRSQDESIAANRAQGAIRRDFGQRDVRERTHRASPETCGR
ncbi:MAG: hypothetical protein R3C20_08430 [Planctomycetaceae bacterium]